MFGACDRCSVDHCRNSFDLMGPFPDTLCCLVGLQWGATPTRTRWPPLGSDGWNNFPTCHLYIIWFLCLCAVKTNREMVQICPDCVSLLPLNNTEGLKAVAQAVSKFNTNTTNKQYYILKEVGRISAGASTVSACLTGHTWPRLQVFTPLLFSAPPSVYNGQRDELLR